MNVDQLGRAPLSAVPVSLGAFVVLECGGSHFTASASVDPTNQSLNWDHHERALGIVRHGHIYGIVRSQVNPSHQFSWERYLTVGSDLEGSARLHPLRLPMAHPVYEIL